MNVANTLIQGLEGAKKTTDQMLKQAKPEPVKTEDTSVIKPTRHRPAEYYKDLGWDKVFKLMGRNMTESSRDVLMETADMFQHPIRTWQGLVGIARSGATKIDEMLGVAPDAPHSFVPFHNELKIMEHFLFGDKAPKFDPQIFDAVTDFYKNAYGLGPHGVAGFKQYIAENPAEFISDFVSIVAMGAQGTGAGLRAGAIASRAKMMQSLARKTKFLDYFPENERRKLRSLTHKDWQEKLQTNTDLHKYLPADTQKTLAHIQKAEEVGKSLYYIGVGESVGGYQPGAWAKLAENFLQYGDIGAIPFLAGAQGAGGLLDLRKKSLGVVADKTDELPYSEKVARYLYAKYKDELTADKLTDINMVENIERISSDDLKYDDIQKYTQEGILKKFDIKRDYNPHEVAKKSHEGYDHHARDEFLRFIEKYPEARELPMESTHRNLVNAWNELENTHTKITADAFNDLEKRLDAPIEVIRVDPTMTYNRYNQEFDRPPRPARHGLTKDVIQYIKRDLGLPELPEKFDKLQKLADTDLFFQHKGMEDFEVEQFRDHAKAYENWYNKTIGTNSVEEIVDILKSYPEYYYTRLKESQKRGVYFRLEDWDANVMEAFSAEKDMILWEDEWGPHLRAYHLSEREQMKWVLEEYNDHIQSRMDGRGRKIHSVEAFKEYLANSKKYMWYHGHRGPGMYHRGVNALPSLEASQQYYIPHAGLAGDAYRSIVVFKGKSLGDNFHKDGKVIQPTEIVKKYIFDMGETFRDSSIDTGFMDVSLHGIDRPTMEAIYKLRDLMEPIIKKQELLDAYHVEKYEYQQNVLTMLDNNDTPFQTERTEESIRHMMEMPDFQDMHRTSTYRLNQLRTEIETQHNLSLNSMVEIENNLKEIVDPSPRAVDETILQPGNQIYEKLKEIDAELESWKARSYFMTEWIGENWETLKDDPGVQELGFTNRHELANHLSDNTNNFVLWADNTIPPPKKDAHTWNYQHGKIRALLGAVYDDFYANVGIGIQNKSMEMLLNRLPVKPENMQLVESYLDNLQVTAPETSASIDDLDALFDEISRLTNDESMPVPESGIRAAPTLGTLPEQLPDGFDAIEEMGGNRFRNTENDTVYEYDPSGVHLPEEVDAMNAENMEQSNSLVWTGNDYSDNEWSQIEQVRQTLISDEYQSLIDIMGENELQNAVVHYYAKDLMGEMQAQSLISEIDKDIPISGERFQSLMQELKANIEPFMTAEKKQMLTDASRHANQQIRDMQIDTLQIKRRNDRLAEGLNVAFQDTLQHYADNFDKIDPYTESQAGRLLLDSNLVGDTRKMFRNMHLQPPQIKAMKYAALRQLFQSGDITERVRIVGRDRMVELWGEEVYKDIDRLSYLLGRMPTEATDDAIGFIRTGLKPDTYMNNILASVPILLNTFGEGDTDIGGLHILFSLIGNETARKILNKKGVMRELLGDLPTSDANKLRRWIYQHKGWVRKSLKAREEENESK